MKLEKAKATAFFNEIVGLRIYLALWVAIGHGLQLSGFITPTNLPMKLLLDGHAAVIVFMIVSGFVITNLLMSKQEPYPRYIVRRFFRLYPAYVLALVLGYFVSGAWADIGQNASYRNVHGWEPYAASLTQLRHEVVASFWPHAIAHAGMLHGAIPTEWLPRAGMTFLPAAWSISLEWQFYLVAPLALAMIRKPATLALVTVTALGAFVLYGKGWLGSYSIGSNLAGVTPYFALGIASRFSYDALSRLRVDPVAAIAVAVFIALTVLSDPIPVLVWSVFLILSLWRGRYSLLAKAFEMMFMSRPAKLLGEASYSLYLLHRPAQVILGTLAMALFQVGRVEMFAVQILAVALAIPVSIMVYFYVERPGVRLGSRLANLLPGRRVDPNPVPVAI